MGSSLNCQLRIFRIGGTLRVHPRKREEAASEICSVPSLVIWVPRSALMPPTSGCPRADRQNAEAGSVEAAERPSVMIPLQTKVLSLQVLLRSVTLLLHP